MLAAAHSQGMLFGVIFWASDYKDTTTGEEWVHGTYQQLNFYDLMDIVPDSYTIESWINAPPATVPEFGPTFMAASTSRSISA